VANINSKKKITIGTMR